MIALIVALALTGPVVVHDSREGLPLGSAGAREGTFAPAPVVYERRVGEWRQWWLAFARNDQDRGIVRTGRHAGDWEMVQVRLDDAGEPVEAVYAQHSGAKRVPVAGGRDPWRARPRSPWGRRRSPCSCSSPGGAAGERHGGWVGKAVKPGFRVNR